MQHNSSKDADELKGENQMKCPSCSNETNIAVAKTEYIYPKWFLGWPTFWRFMSPTVARSITTMILVLCIVLILLALLGFSQGAWFMGLLLGLLAVFALYAFVICVKSLGQDQLKEYYKCSACGLEWSWFKE
jgi:hypothetical protein